MGPIPREWRLPALGVALILAAAGCGASSTSAGDDLAVGGAPDLATLPADASVAGVDLTAAPDLASPGDLATPTDSAHGNVVCNLGNDPLPCAADAACTASGAVCDLAKRYCVCITPNCTPSVDQTCNDNIIFQSFHGHCNAFGACQCLNGNVKSAQSGKCL